MNEIIGFLITSGGAIWFATARGHSKGVWLGPIVAAAGLFIAFAL